ncbi:MAG: hypothetical protein KC983_01700, partial [Phycisphaerales bacterium]|nr:hypothetical protein [Phycisphaerales bacterium]
MIGSTTVPVSRHARHARHARGTLRRRRGAVVVIALWATSIAAITASAIMLYAFRQASYGREAVARVKARWAAR